MRVGKWQVIEMVHCSFEAVLRSISMTASLGNHRILGCIDFALSYLNCDTLSSGVERLVRAFRISCTVQSWGTKYYTLDLHR